MNPARDMNALVALAVDYAIEQGCVLATDGAQVEVMREPLMPGWTRIAVRIKEPEPLPEVFLTQAA